MPQNPPVKLMSRSFHVVISITILTFFFSKCQINYQPPNSPPDGKSLCEIVLQKLLRVDNFEIYPFFFFNTYHK